VIKCDVIHAGRAR